MRIEGRCPLRRGEVPSPSCCNRTIISSQKTPYTKEPQPQRGGMFIETVFSHPSPQPQRGDMSINVMSLSQFHKRTVFCGTETLDFSVRTCYAMINYQRCNGRLKREKAACPYDTSFPCILRQDLLKCLATWKISKESTSKNQHNNILKKKGA